MRHLHGSHALSSLQQLQLPHIVAPCIKLIFPQVFIQVSSITVNSSPKTLQGIGWMVMTGLLFVSVTGVVRHLGSQLPAVEAAFLRYSIGLILISPVFLRLRHHRPGKKNMILYVCRGLVHGFAVMLWFYAMARIPIAEVTAIGYVSPIFVTLGAAFFLKEKLKFRRIMGILFGFIGALIILRPGFETINLGQLPSSPLPPCLPPHSS